MKKLIIFTACSLMIMFQSPAYSADYPRCDTIEQRAEAHEQAGMYPAEVANWLAKEVFLTGKAIEQCNGKEANGKMYVIRGWLVKENILYRARYKGRFGFYKP